MGTVKENTTKRVPPRTFTSIDANKFLKRGYQALRQRNYKDAGACCALVLKYMPKLVNGHFLAGLVAIETHDWPVARQAFQSVVSIDENHAAGWAQLARCFVTLGQYNNAEKALERGAGLLPEDPLVQDVIGTVYSLLGDQKAALEWFDKTCMSTKGAQFQLSRAKSLTFLGRIGEAREALEAVINEFPKAGQAHLMLSRLERVKNDVHIEAMNAIVAKEPATSPSLPFFYYAIGKEHEDLENWDAAFEGYRRGAEARRKEVSFDETAEIAMFDALQNTLTKSWYEAQTTGNSDPSPIFIIGQPRTGTTLIERIITAHSNVQSAGELQQFAMAVKRMVGANSPKPMTADIIERAADIDMKKLADLYLETTRSVRPRSPKFVDKLPVNYLYAPLIAAAFPNAKIVHLVRGAMDSCFSSYKQLFADAYFHSYDQEEMARHHLRYRRLMTKWRKVLGNRVLDVQYEDTVADLEFNARKIIDFLGLEWQESCLEFYKQEDAVTTASATQVREKAHSRSVGRWRKFEGQLGPMKKVLSEAGH